MRRAISGVCLAISKFGPFGITVGNPSCWRNSDRRNVAACPAATFGGVSRIVAQPAHNFNWFIKQDMQLGNDTITARYIFNRGNFFNTSDNGAAGYFFNVPALSQAGPDQLDA